MSTTHTHTNSVCLMTGTAGGGVYEKKKET